MAAADTTKPILTGFTLQQSIDVTNGDAVATFGAMATDEASGIDYVTLILDRSYQTGFGRSQSISFYDSSDSFQDGGATFSQIFTTASAAGTYSVTTVYVYDKAGNYAIYSAADLKAHGIDTDFVVKSGAVADTTKPTLTGFSFQQSIDVTNGDVVATFAAAATDDASGIDYVALVFDKSYQANFGRTQGISFYGSRDSFDDGTATYNEIFTTASAAGTYTVTTAYVFDKAGNYMAYSAADLKARGFDIDFVVKSNTVADTTKPTLTGFSLQQSIDVTNGDAVARFAATATDDASGVDYVALILDRPYQTGFGRSQSISFYSSADSFADGASTYSQVFSTASAAGTYNITTAYVYDKAGNFTVYSTTDLNARGFDTDFTVIDRNVAPVATISVSAPSYVIEGRDAGFTPSLTFRNVSTLNTTIEVSLSSTSTATNGADVRVPAQAFSISRTQSPAGDYVLNLATIPILDDALREGNETIALRVKAPGQIFADGSDSTIVTVKLIDDDIDALRYLASYADLRAAFGLNEAAARSHYINFGIAEGRDPTRFDPLLYAASNPDLARAFGADTAAATAHYLKSGIAEGRATSGFDAYLYAASNPDLARAFGGNVDALLTHYLANGLREGRSTTGFDALRYAASNPDLARAFGSDIHALAQHYVSNGLAEGRRTDSFDALEYAATNPDLARAYGLDEAGLTFHYVNYGIAEGRAAIGFDSVAYLLTYADLGRAGFDADTALRHWVDHGVGESRIGDTAFGREQPDHILQFGAVTHGLIDQARDRDWYGVTLHAGETIRLDLAGDGVGKPGLPDPIMTLYDAHGVAVAFDDNDGPGRDAAIRYTATTDGTYYVEAAGGDKFGFFDIGNYTLMIAEVLV